MPFQETHPSQHITRDLDSAFHTNMNNTNNGYSVPQYGGYQGRSHIQNLSQSAANPYAGYGMQTTPGFHAGFAPMEPAQQPNAMMHGGTSGHPPYQSPPNSNHANYFAPNLQNQPPSTYPVNPYAPGAMYPQQSNSAANGNVQNPNVHANPLYHNNPFHTVPNPSPNGTSTRVTLPSPSAVADASVGGGAMHATPYGIDPIHPLVMQVGLQYGRDFLHKTEGRFSSVFLAPFEALRKYFMVDDRYVARKLWNILQPFRREYTRQCGNIDHEGVSEKHYSSPLDDVAAPDLYIPIMALLTYVLLSASAVVETRTPALLTAYILRTFLYLFFEVSTLKVGSYLSQFPLQLPWLEALALCGYKLVLVCLLAILSFIPIPAFGSLLFIGSFWGCIASTYFFFNTLAQYSMRRHRVTYRGAPFLYFASMLQAVLFYWYAWWAINPSRSLFPF